MVVAPGQMSCGPVEGGVQGQGLLEMWDRLRILPCLVVGQSRIIRALRLEAIAEARPGAGATGRKRTGTETKRQEQEEPSASRILHLLHSSCVRLCGQVATPVPEVQRRTRGEGPGFQALPPRSKLWLT